MAETKKQTAAKKREQNPRLDDVEARLDALSNEVKDAMEEIAEQLEEITQAVTQANGVEVDPAGAQQDKQSDVPEDAVAEPGDEQDEEPEGGEGEEQQPAPADKAAAETEASNGSGDGSRLPHLSVPGSIPRPSNAVLIAAGAGTAAAITTVLAAKLKKGSSLPVSSE